jgi:transposase
MPSHFIPRGVGYPFFFRQRVKALDNSGQSTQKILSHFRISPSTLQRWRKNHFLNRISQKGGKKTRISEHLRSTLANIVDALPDLMLSELQELIREIHLVDLKITQISKQLKILGFTCKLLTVCSQSANRTHQKNWWNNLPIGPQGTAGCVGISTWHMIDIDECGIYYSMCNRRYGHSRRGTRAIAHLPGKEISLKAYI